MKALQGTLMVKVITANLKQDSEYLVGKIDPFCRIKVNNEQAQTTEKLNAGKKPTWGEIFSFYCRLGEGVKYSVFDQDPNIIGENLLGEGEFPLTDYYVNKACSFWFPLKIQDLEAGELGMEVTFFPDNESCLKTVEQLQTKLANKIRERDSIKRLNSPGTVETKGGEEPAISSEFLKIENERIRENLDKLKERLTAGCNSLEKLKEDTARASHGAEAQAETNRNLAREIEDLRKTSHLGKITIDRMSLSIKESTDLVSEMDPYIIFICGDETRKTSVKRDGGCNTAWDEQIEIPYFGQDAVKFFVMDQETLEKDDLIAVTSLGLYHVVASKGRVHQQVLLHGIEELGIAGTFFFDIQFTRA